MQGQGTLEVRGRNSTGPLRVQPAAGPRRLVVKLDSSLLARPDGLLDEASLYTQRGDAALCVEGRAELLVSSGAVAAGRTHLPDIGAHLRDGDVLTEGGIAQDSIAVCSPIVRGCVSQKVAI
jgi:hypothetical protein